MKPPAGLFRGSSSMGPRPSRAPSRLEPTVHRGARARSRRAPLGDGGALPRSRRDSPGSRLADPRSPRDSVGRRPPRARARRDSFVSRPARARSPRGPVRQVVIHLDRALSRGLTGANHLDDSPDYRSPRAAMTRSTPPGLQDVGSRDRCLGPELVGPPQRRGGGPRRAGIARGLRVAKRAGACERELRQRAVGQSRESHRAPVS